MKSPGTAGAGLTRAMKDSETAGRLKTPAAPPAETTGLRLFETAEVTRSPFNREEFDQVELAKLTDQVKVDGVLVPGCVRPIPKDRYAVEARTRGGKRGFVVRLNVGPREIDALKGYEVGKFDKINWEVRAIMLGEGGTYPISLSKHATNEDAARARKGQLTEELAKLKKADAEAELFATREEAEAHVPKWEIVYGERRWLAAKAAGCRYPAIVRDLNDTEALEQQALENMQREDLNAVDEAIKFDQLRAAYQAEGLTKGEAIARIQEKTGMGESTIYQRLTLMLLPADLQKKVRSGDLPPSHAELVTKMPDLQAQQQLAKGILHPDHWRANEQGIMSYRDAKNLADDILRKAKNLAEWQSKAEEFEKKGWSVLTPVQCKKLMPHGYLSGGEYKELSDYAANGTQWEKLIPKGKLPNPVLARKPDGSPKIIYKTSELLAAAKDAGVPMKQASGGNSSYAKEQARKAVAHKRRLQVFGLLSSQAITAAESGAAPEGFLRVVLWAQLNGGIDHRFLKDLIARRGFKGKSRDDRDWIRDAAKVMNQKELRGLIIELAVERFGPNEWCDRHNERLPDVCAALGLDFKAADKAVPKVQTPGKAKAGKKKGEGQDAKI